MDAPLRNEVCVLMRDLQEVNNELPLEDKHPQDRKYHERQRFGTG
jgi:hypothetical protein